MKPSEKNKKANNTTDISFMKFMKQKEQKLELIVIAALYIVFYFVLKFVYPFPGGTADSGSYVAAGMRGFYDGYRPYGYSNFLVMLHDISENINFIVVIQYILNAISSIFFVFTLKYFFKPKNKVLYYSFLTLALGSIITICLANNILSDSLFTSLSVAWLTLCFWFAKSKKTMPRLLLLAAKFLLLYLLINVRYTGVLFFGMEVVLILFAMFKDSKLLSFAATAILILIYTGFYKKQVEKSEKATQVEVFSGFSGWLSVNSAMHATPHIEIDKRRIKNKSFAEFYKFMKPIDTAFVKTNKTTVAYMWSNDRAPKKYMYYTMKKNKWPYIKSWTYVSKIYDEFGKYIMMNYPFKYFRYYLLPNSYGVFYPTKDEIYHMYKPDALTEKELKWYNIEDKSTIYSRSEFFHKLFPFFPVYRLLIYILTAEAIVMLFVKKLLKQMSGIEVVIVSFISILLVLFIAFHIYAAPFCLRYIVPVHLCQIGLLYIVANRLLNKKEA